MMGWMMVYFYQEFIGSYDGNGNFSYSRTQENIGGPGTPNIIYVWYNVMLGTLTKIYLMPII